MQDLKKDLVPLVLRPELLRKLSTWLKKIPKKADIRFCTVIFALCCLLFAPLQVAASSDLGVFAGGCFWCLEHDFEDIPGVLNVESGYTGGDLINPTYQNHTGHQEAISVSYDSTLISYEDLLRVYWRNIDPLDGEGQFCDRGDSYKPVIFTNNTYQEEKALLSLQKVAKELNLPIEAIKVQITENKQFWSAEDYHQDYAVNNPVRYKFYRYSCGRDKRLLDVWGERAKTMNAW